MKEAKQARRAIGIASAITLLVFTAALVVFVIPQPCAPAAPGSRLAFCLPLNLVEGIVLYLMAAALATLAGLAGS
jgi:hypothetical protein